MEIKDLRDEESGHVVFAVAIDDETLARLIKVCEECGAPPALVISSIVRDVLEDDEREHTEEGCPEPLPPLVLN